MASFAFLFHIEVFLAGNKNRFFGSLHETILLNLMVSARDFQSSSRN
jgi:hypothetical protein